MNMTHTHRVSLTPNTPATYAVINAIKLYCEDNCIAYKIFEDTLGITIEYGGNIVHQFLDKIPLTNCAWK